MKDSCVMRSELFQAEDFLRKLAWKYAKNQEDANDLMQETQYTQTSSQGIESARFFI